MSFSFTPECVMALPLRPDDLVLAKTFRSAEATFGTHIICTEYYCLGPVFQITTMGSDVVSFLIWRTPEGAHVGDPSNHEWPEGPAGLSMAEAFALVSEETRHAREVAAATRSSWRVAPIRHK
jgi:hypothetical protein